MTRKIGPIERALRDRHGVLDDASPLVFLGMDAHMDWDWLNTFQDLVTTGNGNGQGSAQQLLSSAWECMIGSQGSTIYPYAVCEMGFLRAALQTVPSLMSQFTQYNLGQQLYIEGGGITSPDNLLSHGEAFIRNYLVGGSWVRQTLGLTSSFAYLPDDFGHDAQLPVMLGAMGFTGISFSRLPGSWGSPTKTPISGTSLYQQLLNSGADFFWQSSDGSTVLAHMMQDSYSQGKGLQDDCDDLPAAVTAVQDYVKYNQPSSPSPNIYVPCGNDFAMPIPCLVQIASAYNAQVPAPPVTAIASTLPEYMAVVAEWAQNGGTLGTLAIDPTPYWTGFYASRPGLKILHHAATRRLLGAEVFDAVAATLKTADALAWAPIAAARRAAIQQGWEAVLPSTHHDYVTGTAVDSVYTEEQRPLLEAAAAMARGTLQATMIELAGMVDASPGKGELPVVVFNQLGFARSAAVVCTAPRGTSWQSVRSSDQTYAPVQALGDDRWLFQAAAPSLGYTTYYLSDQQATNSPVVSVSETDEMITLTSDLVTATIVKSRFELLALVPIVGGQPQDDLIPSDKNGNQLVFYKDLGNLYNFGNEADPSGGLTEQAPSPPTVTDIQIRERGPLRARIEATVSFAFDDGSDSTASYLVEYLVVAGEPMLHMAVTGAVPLPADPSKGGTPYAVMVRTPLTSGGNAAVVDGVLRGTPYHWHDQLPVAYWPAPTFQATHHFVVPSAGGTTLAGFYHRDIPAWAIDGNGDMIACILRNTPGTYPWPTGGMNLGANGVDFDRHRRAYALRVPQGLPVAPSLLSVFQEAWSYATPLAAAIGAVPSAGVSSQHQVDAALPATFSLAQVTSDNAVLTVAKAADADPQQLVLRLYQPSTTSQSVTIELAAQIGAGALTPITALEQPIDGAQPVAVTASSATVTMDRAIATFEVTAAGGSLSQVRSRG
jgi:alpha-mannosidase